MSLVSNHEIAQAVADLADFLDSYGISFWPEHLRRELDGLRMGDEQASRNLVAYFGGMGNLDDLIITPANGHSVSEAEGESATRECDATSKNFFRQDCRSAATGPSPKQTIRASGGSTAAAHTASVGLTGFEPATP
jgi:hypothetical protein